MDSDKQKSTLKNGIGDDLPYRIAGLEKAKAEPDMTPADIAALDRAIITLKEKLAAKNEPKAQD